MPTIAQIEANLLLASSTGNSALLSTTLSSITAEQKSLITVYPTVLYNIVIFPESLNSNLVATMARSLMSSVGVYVNTYAIGGAMFMFSQSGNYAALDAVTDYLTATQKTNLGSSPYFGFALSNIDHNDQPWTTNDDATIANVVRDLMSKLGAHAPAYAIGSTMMRFAENGNYLALDAVTDYLTATQKTTLSSSQYFGFALNNIAADDQPWTTNDDATIANVVRDLMSKLGGGTLVSSYDLLSTNTYAASGNINGVDAVIGELAAAKFDNSFLSLIQPSLSAANITLGTQFANTYNGSIGTDKYLGLDGNDILYGNGGNDYLFGDAGTDMIYGGNQNDFLHGGSGNDTIYGDAGNDVLYGGRGTDILYGGEGMDTFAFETADRGTGTDTIKGFSISQGDRIDISDVLSQYDPVSDLLSKFVKLTTSGADTLLQLDVDGSAGVYGFETFAKIEAVTGLDMNVLVANGNLVA